MQRIFRNNGLSIVVFGLFLVFFLGESIAGHLAHNEDREQHNRPPIDYIAYVTSGAFLESTAENWESEFLEMAGYVVLTAILIQRGSAESRRPDRPEPSDRDPRLEKNTDGAPWPVRRGGWVLKAYEHSLSIGFLTLFVIAFLIHAIGGTHAYNEEQQWHGEAPVSVGDFMLTSQFWFQSFQNWQSEFLGLGSMIVLSIFLRQRGSPESKPVDAPHLQTGKD
jgi:hypothetical protein